MEEITDIGKKMTVSRKMEHVQLKPTARQSLLKKKKKIILMLNKAELIVISVNDCNIYTDNTGNYY